MSLSLLHSCINTSKELSSSASTRSYCRDLSGHYDNIVWRVLDCEILCSVEGLKENTCFSCILRRYRAL